MKAPITIIEHNKGLNPISLAAIMFPNSHAASTMGEVKPPPPSISTGKGRNSEEARRTETPPHRFN
jgi:hypothetical protein